MLAEISIAETRNKELVASLAEEVQNLHAQWHPGIFKPFNKTEMEKAVEGFFADPSCRCFVAAQNDVAIGCIVLFIREVKENAFQYSMRTLHVDQISVLSAYRKSGAGALLLRQAEIIARENNISRIELDHWSLNTVAAAFFRKQGYHLYREKLWKLLD